ncbi:MAG: hypothetical protein ACRD2W_01155, partial [Acidimicrobiales bacterium]
HYRQGHHHDRTERWMVPQAALRSKRVEAGSTPGQPQESAKADGDAVANFYGKDAGSTLTGLLRDHILVAGDLISAAKAGDNAAVSKASDAWYANSDQIAEFLAGANSAWPVDSLKEMMRGHLDQTLAEATAQLTGDYARSVAEYDHIVSHILDMADTLSAGIVSAFPDRFHTSEIPQPAIAVNDSMRRLWTDHVAWTRLFIVSAVAGLPDTEATAGRLLQNQADIGDAVANFYGKDARSTLTGLLRDHILVAADLVGAAKTGDNAGVSKASDAWYVNADQIAEFLAGANAAWPVDSLKVMMKGHLDQTLAEATAQLTGDYARSVAEYDHIVSHVLDMADTLSAGLVSAFPDRFNA